LAVLGEKFASAQIDPMTFLSKPAQAAPPVLLAQKQKSNIATKSGQGWRHQNSSAARNPFLS
jgi:hypothetical protein